MIYPERFAALPDYPWPRLRKLLDGIAPGGPEILMTIGEPKHAFPAWITDIITENAAGFNSYPPNDGMPDLLETMTNWIATRFGAALDPETQIMALNGTREGLFNACMALCPPDTNVLVPNPFYSVYGVAAKAAGSTPHYIPALAENGFLPDFAGLPADVLDKTSIVYMCSPTNPEGAVASPDYWRDLLALAEKHDFIIFADECYSEIYRDMPPVGGLQMVNETGANPERVVVFHSLSKRSNLPGLRSGFVASGPENIRRIKQLRAYAGAPLPLPLQHAAKAAWADEAHVVENRALYNAKFEAAAQVFDGLNSYRSPEAGFFLWLPVEDSEKATVKLWQETGVKVLPGAYLSREAGGITPGAGFIRVALVAPINETRDGLTRLRSCLYD
ncbi:MAG: aminotransferase class I/II-fold pyridoxal phosphate-dependent enzyme [Pseudomonadota bacterium]